MLEYMSGFGNECATEAVKGALPIGRNSPQRPAFGLYAEQFSGTAFTMPRHENRRSWFYRIRPAAMHGTFEKISNFPDESSYAHCPNRMRWGARPEAGNNVGEVVDFHDSVMPVLANGSPEALSGVVFMTYAANKNMGKRAFFNSDGELMILSAKGRLDIRTEMGRIALEPQQIAVIPRGLRFSVDLPDGSASGYIAENRGEPFRIPDLGPIGANGLANPRDFETPVAWYEDETGEYEIIQKYMGQMWRTVQGHSPFDVVAWHGNNAPYRYDLRHFNTIGTISYDHPDPSIFTVLTSPSAVAGRANADFVIFPPRWMVGEDTFRPPWFHRNLMSEAMGLLHGAYDAKQGGFVPGAISLHNCMNAHGSDVASWKGATEAELKPEKIDNTMAFMVESCWPYKVHPAFADSMDPDYDAVWDGFPAAQLPK